MVRKSVTHRFEKRLRRTVLALAMLPLGCQLAPEHTVPDLPTAAAYPAEVAGTTADGRQAAVFGWRDFIADARLEALIASAFARNRTLAVALAQIEEAQALYRVQRADRLPDVGLNGNVTRSRIIAGGAIGGLPAGAGGTLESWSAAVAMPAFEIDLWGRVRNLSEAALAQYLATESAARTVALTLVREVANAYLATLEASERIRLAEATVDSRRQELRIAERRLEAGVIAALELAQAETLLTQAETELAALRLQHARSANALTVLVGGPLDEPLPPAAPLGQQVNPDPLAAGLPSELLVTRPDILAAEERLRAARANIGAARAAYFPSITLTASSGYTSTELVGLFGQDGNTWTYGPALTVPLFDFGRRRANVNLAEARAARAVAEYERSIQVAFQEVADGLAGRRYLAEQVDAQMRQTEAQRRLAEFARRRYEEGVISYLEVLDAERNLFAAEQALLQVRRAEEANLVALYVALGGGLLETSPP